MARISVTAAGLIVASLAACSTYDPYYSSTPTPNQPVVSPVSATSATTVAPAPVGQIIAPPAAVPPVAVAPAAVPAAPAWRPGSGTVESVSLVRVATASASTGSSTAGRTAYRLSVRMDDGTVQSIDQDSRSFMVGDRVEISSAGRVSRR